MKRMKFLPVLFLALSLLLSACGGGTASDYDPKAVTAALKDSDAFSSALEEITADTIPEYFGLNADLIKDSAAYVSLSAGAEEFAVLVCTGNSEAEQAMDALTKHIEYLKTALKDYQPDEVAKLDNAIIKTRGSSVLLVVPADADAAQAIIDKL